MDDEQVRRLQAEAEALEAKQAAVEKARDAASAPRPETPRGPDGFAAMLTLYSGMQASEFGWLLGMGSLLGGIGVLLLATTTDWDGENATIAFGLSFMGVLPWLFFLSGVARYVSYRGWRDRLPFEIGGAWDTLAATEEENKWYPTKLEIVLKKNDDGTKAALEAMLRIFSVYANRSHYRPMMGGLTAWKAKGLEANGDVGGRVGWKLYRFISGDLARYARKGAPIAAVRISLGKGHRVQPHTDTS